MTLNTQPSTQASSQQTSSPASSGQVAPEPVTPLKYAVQMKDIAKCPSRKLKTEIGLGYRFAFSKLSDPRNFLPIALISPERIVPVPPGVKKPVKECCEGWSLSMYTTLDALQNKAKSAIEISPMFLKRVGDCFTQIKLTPACGGHTPPNNKGHFEFFERATFDGLKAVVHHQKMAL